MKFLIVDKSKRVGDLDSQHYAVQRIIDSLGKKQIEHEFCHFDEISICVENGQLMLRIKGKPLTDFSHIIMRGHRREEFQIKQAVVFFSEKHGIKVQNAEFIKLMPSYNKLFQQVFMAQNGIPYIDSAYVLNGMYHEESETLDRLEFPLIYKHVWGEYRVEKIDGEDKLKKNVFLVNNIDELKKQCTDRSDPQDYFIQKYVDIGEDTRAMMIDGKFIGGWKREANESFLTVGGKPKYSLFNNPDQEYLELVEKTAKLFKAQYCALDVIYYKDKPHILEINMDPGFKAFETKIEGMEIDIAMAIVDNMLEK
ncbi:hypothetical protein JW887_02945 [Candidatus Dojkabacteria bacterium]|nr:hypothetical protein [Candidatus Dojkabacteria bacterium]